MTKIVRWNPFREMMHLRQEIDRLFDESLAWDTPFARAGAGDLALDLFENDDSFIVEAAVPGIDPGDLDIDITDNVLTIRGEFKEEREEEGKRWHLRERRTGSFARQVRFPIKVNAAEVTAEYVNGVLKLTVAKAEEVKPKRIHIKVTEKNPKVIEGKTV